MAKKKRTKQYPAEVIASCKKLYVYDNWSFRKISAFYDGKPHWQTLQNWSEENKKSWEDERREYMDSVMDRITPKQIEQLYMQRIYEVLSDPKFTTKSSDSLRKLQKNFREITDPGHQIPVVYAMLTELIEYLKKYHGSLISKEFLDAVRDYKNYQRSKLQP